MDLITWKVLDNLEQIETERRRILPLSKEGNPHWKWMNEWLKKTNEEHLKNKGDCEICNMCGDAPRKILHTSFSFCDEYDCGMSLCFSCIDELHKLKEDVKSGD